MPVMAPVAAGVQSDRIHGSISGGAQKMDGMNDQLLTTSKSGAIDLIEEHGQGDLPVCMAKTQYSFSADSSVKGAPSGHTLPVREVRLAAGAGFVVAVCGDIMTMPGLPRHPAALDIALDENGLVVGLT